MKKNFMFTSESVTEGHPDKMCDQISDAVLDHFLEQDPYARVRAECAISTSILFIAARFASEVKADIPTLARKVISQIGYRQPDFDAPTCSVLTSLQEYPPTVDLYFKEKNLTDQELEKIPVRLAGILRNFNLRYLPSLNRGGFFRKLAAYGQVGRPDLKLPWEATDKVSILQAS